MNENEIIKYDTKLYDDIIINDIINKEAIFLSYVGKYDNKNFFLFGKTIDLHSLPNIFNNFDIIKIWKTTNANDIKLKLKINFINIDVLILHNFGPKNITQEILYPNAVYNLSYCINMIDKIILDYNSSKNFKHQNSKLFGSKKKLHSQKIKLTSDKIQETSKPTSNSQILKKSKYNTLSPSKHNELSTLTFKEKYESLKIENEKLIKLLESKH